MPAAGGIAATNYIFSTAPKDGTMIALVQRGMLLAKLTYPGGTRFEIDRFHWLTSLNSETAVTLAWNDTAPHRPAKDLFEKELIVGGIVGVDPETTPKLYNSLIGTKFKVVNGYNSTAQIALAMERGEVHGIADWSWSSIKSVRPYWLRDKKVNMLVQFTVERLAALPQVPTLLELTPPDRKDVVEFISAGTPFSRALAVGPGVPADRVAALRKAFDALMVDKAFLADAEKRKLDIDPRNAAQAHAMLDKIVNASPELVARVKKAIGQED
jgi:tripartite-type tricarboxylate transporter receptor subunit TctC